MRFGYWLVQSFVKVILILFWGLKIHNKKNLPKTGAVIVASNHISFIDPLVIGVSIFREATFAAKKELFKNVILGSIITYLNSIPVRRTGFDNEALKYFIKALKKDQVLIMFPEGTRSRIGTMLPFKRGVGYMVAKTGATILPTYLVGTDKLKKRFFKPGGITIRFGEPIPNLADKYDGEEKYELIAKDVQRAVEKLKEEAEAK